MRNRLSQAAKVLVAAGLVFVVHFIVAFGIAATAAGSTGIYLVIALGFTAVAFSGLGVLEGSYAAGLGHPGARPTELSRLRRVAATYLLATALWAGLLREAVAAEPFGVNGHLSAMALYFVLPGCAASYVFFRKRVRPISSRASGMDTSTSNIP